ncbi:MFS transporter [Nonomuraea roseola]|uniref:MFS transporter n=1 Tax=Nonomuraea roseola TaxID=46179 RepID=UPI0031F76C23
MPDRVPVGQRGEVSGWIGVPQSVGVVLAVVPGHRRRLHDQVRLPPGRRGGGGAGVLPFVLTTKDPRLSERPPFDPGQLWVRSADFFWGVDHSLPDDAGQRDLHALPAVLPHRRGRLREAVPGEKASDGLLVLILLYTGAVVLTTVVAGVVSDRLGRRRLLVTVSGLISAVPALMLAFWPQWPVVMAAAVVLGLGFGVYLSVDNALVTQVLPTATGRAKDLGVINVANSGPQVLGPVIAGPIVAGLGGYPVLYLTAGGLALLGAALVWKIRGVP